jgi:hypothetical protein
MGASSMPQTEERQFDDGRGKPRPSLARWAYSELVSPDQGRKYNGPGIEQLRAKCCQKLPFDGLDQTECAQLLSGWQAVRGTGTIFCQLLNGISTFEVHDWSRDQLAAVFVIPNFTRDIVSDSLAPFLRVNFRTWFEAEPVRPLHQGNARYAAIGSPSPWRQADPITVARYPDDGTAHPFGRLPPR